MKVIVSRAYFGPSQHGGGPGAYVRVDCSAEELAASAHQIDALWRGFCNVLTAASGPEAGASLRVGPAAEGMGALLAAAVAAVGRSVGEALTVVPCGGESGTEAIEISAQGEDAEVGRRAAVLAVGSIAGLLAPPGEPAGESGDLREALAALAAFAAARRPSPSQAAILAAAAERKIPVICLDRWPLVAEDTLAEPERRGLLQLGQGIYRQQIAGTATLGVLARTHEQLSNRAAAVLTLRRAGIPVPQGDPEPGTINNARRAVRSAQRIGYPVVLKPLRGPSGKGISLGLSGDAAVVSAFEAASRYDRHVILERHIPGETYRLLLIGGEVVAACRRPVGGAGGSPATPRPMHPERLGVGLRATARAAADAFSLAVAGVDLVTPDPTLPLDAVGGAVIRVDPAPDLGLHLRDRETLPLSLARRFLAHLYPEGAPTRIPIAAVTGTSGKTTTCRMVGRILEAAGYRVGLACTDGVYVGGDLMRRGVFSGISGALQLFSDPRVEVAVLETSRGTLVQRGLGFDHPTVGACTKVEADHIGLEGIDTLTDMARLKRVVVERAREMAVLNAEDPLCLAMIPHLSATRTALVSTDPGCQALVAHTGAGGLALVLDAEGGVPTLMQVEGTRREAILAVADIPATWGGAADHNVQNALFAAAIALGLGATPAAIRQGLTGFHASPSDSPKRLNRYDGLPFQVIIDQAGTVPGFRALCDFVDKLLVRGRRLLLFYGIGDRRDQDLRDIGQRVARSFDLFICFEDAHYCRGRPEGEIPALFTSALVAEGVAQSQISLCKGAHEGVQQALALAATEDLVVLVVPGPAEQIIGWLDETLAAGAIKASPPPDAQVLA